MDTNKGGRPRRPAYYILQPEDSLLKYDEFLDLSDMLWKDVPRSYVGQTARQAAYAAIRRKLTPTRMAYSLGKKYLPRGVNT